MSICSFVHRLQFIRSHESYYMVKLSMEEIAIKYWSPHGRQEEKKFQVGHSKIDLVMRAAKRIDLSNVSKFKSLHTLDLSHNMLDQLDLSPLAACSLLNDVRIQSNHLTSLDLWPLLNCKELKEMDISENRLHGLDLSPIFLKTNVRMDSFVVISADLLLRYIFTRDELGKRFRLIRTDGAPWTAPPVIMWLAYTDLANRLEWIDIKKRIDPLLSDLTQEQWFSAQRGLLSGLGMVELAGFDGNPMELLIGTNGGISFKEAIHTIYDNVVRLLEKQLDNNGPTLFLDIDRMRKTRASKLIPTIVERRRNEVENAVIPSIGSKVYLESLWMTHYGFHILKATNADLVTNLETFNSIKRSFYELGMSIATQSIPIAQLVDSIRTSRGMHRHVLDFIRGFYD
jgi:hypothetical protein